MKIRTYIIIFFSLVLSACATVVMPDGGPKDTTPPIPLAYIPENGSCNLKTDKIVIKFDEFIILDKLTQQLVVSPQMPEKPEISIQGKKLIIKLPDSLRTNTTYTIFFGNAVVNYTENIPVRNFSYVFSTGDVVDSLQIKGKALKAFDNTAYEEVFVMLYKDTDDSVIYKDKPYYLAKPNSKGNFELNNLAPGKYQIYALADANRNYIYDQETEEIAFLDSLISPYIPEHLHNHIEFDSTINLEDSIRQNVVIDKHENLSFDLFLFKERPDKSILIENKIYPPNKVMFVFNRDVKNLKISPIDFNPPSGWLYQTHNSTFDTIYTFLKNLTKDTINIALSEGDENIDTLKLILTKQKKGISTSRRRNSLTQENKKEEEKKTPKIVLSHNLSSSFPFYSNIKLKFAVPLKEYHFDKLELYKSKDTSWIPLKFTPKITDTVNLQEVTLFSNFGERETYKLLIQDSAFFDIFDATNDSIEKDLSTNEYRQYGSLKLQIKTNSPENMIIQLINSKEMVVVEHYIQGDSQIDYPYLNDGKYRIKAIIDKNNNRKWDTGDLEKHLQPETVFFLNQVIDIRANWDNEQTWILNE